MREYDKGYTDGVKTALQETFDELLNRRLIHIKSFILGIGFILAFLDGLIEAKISAEDLTKQINGLREWLIEKEKELN
jgi:hypothetical protein